MSYAVIILSSALYTGGMFQGKFPFTGVITYHVILSPPLYFAPISPTRWSERQTGPRSNCCLWSITCAVWNSPGPSASGRTKQQREITPLAWRHTFNKETNNLLTRVLLLGTFFFGVIVIINKRKMTQYWYMSIFVENGQKMPRSSSFETTVWAAPSSMKVSDVLSPRTCSPVLSSLLFFSHWAL